jgi:hypothetical protein
MRNIPKQIHISVVLVVIVLVAYRMAWVILGIYSPAW